MRRSLLGFIAPRNVRRRQAGRWRPTLERLEDRAVPAGNVLATQAGDTLTLTGDDLANSVQLLPGGAPNSIVVQGDNTTINGSSRSQTFTGVTSLSANLMGGDDRLTANGIVISAPSFSQFKIDGGAGDDRLELLNCNIQSAGGIDLEIYGEQVTAGDAPDTSGNDTIRIVGSTITSQGGSVLVQAVGTDNQGGVVTGGNDTITVTDSNISSSGGGFFNFTTVELDGTINNANAGQTSTIGGGNDQISVTGSTISAGGGGTSFSNILSVGINGSLNTASGFDFATSSVANSSATIGGGNDSIDVRGTTFAVSGPSFGTNALVQIVGDQNDVSGFPGATVTGTIGGGNSQITVADSGVTATGGAFFGNGAFMEIQGLGAGAGFPGATSTIGGGSDTITVRNTNVTATGTPFDSATLVIHSKDVGAFQSAVSVIGAGNDVVSVSNVQVTGDVPGASGFIDVETGAGNDSVQILNSSAGNFYVSLGDGNDTLTFNNNAVGLGAFLDGGPGFDRLDAHHNTGPVTWTGFEDVNVTS